jgi:RHS repeat-associated protein
MPRTARTSLGPDGIVAVMGTSNRTLGRDQHYVTRSKAATCSHHTTYTYDTSYTYDTTHNYDYTHATSGQFAYRYDGSEHLSPMTISDGDDRLRGLRSVLRPCISEKGLQITEDQRYCASTFGRFMTPDRGSGEATEPGSWNRYGYVQGDPINFTDRRGLYRDAEDCIDDPESCEAEDLAEAINWEAFVESPGVPRNLQVAYMRWVRNALAAATLALIEQRTQTNGRNPSIPTFLQFQSACWTIGIPGSVLSFGFTVHVKYQILDQNGKPMSGSQLTTTDIAEGFSDQTGDLNLQPGPVWEYNGGFGDPEVGIQNNGTITDLLSAGGGIAGSAPHGSAFQTFTAGGAVNGVPCFLPLKIMGLGPTNSVLDNTYDVNFIRINGRTFNRNNTPQCPQ